MAFLNGVEVGLEVDGVVVVFAELQSNLGVGRSGVVACAGVAQIHPAASDDLVADVACLEFGVIIVAQAAAHPCAVFGEVLGNIAALGVECLEGLAFGSDVNEHCADHERVAVDKIGCVGQGNSHAAACCACNVVVVIKRAEVKLGRNCVVVIDAAARSVGSVVVINACREVNGNRALDDRVGLDGHGVHCADCGIAFGELISPVAAVDAEGGVIAVYGGAAGLAGGKGHALCGVPAVIGVPYGSVVAVLSGDCRHVFCAVFNAAQIVAEPTVKDIVVAFAVNVELEVAGRVAGSEVSVLVEQELYVYAGLLVCLIHQVKFLGADVVVVEAVNYECRALDVLCVKSVVTGSPVLGVVAVGGELILLDLIQIVAVLLGDGSVVGRIEVTAVAVPCEHLRIACRPCAGGNALRVCVLIPACDACYGDDGLEAGNAGGGQTELSGACIGATGHADLAAGPVCRDGDVAGLVGVGYAIAVQPFDDALERIDLKIGAAGLEAVRALGAETAALDDGKAAHEVVVVPLEIFVVVRALGGVPVVPICAVCVRGGLRGGCAACRSACCRLAVELGNVIALAAEIFAGAHGIVAAGDVGASFVDGSCLVVALDCRTWNLNNGLDEVELAVIVGVVVGLDVYAVADDVAVGIAVAGLDRTGGVREYGLSHTVHVKRLELIGMQCVVHGVGNCLHLTVSVKGAGRVGVGIGTDHAHAASQSKIVGREGAELLFAHARPKQQCAHCVCNRQLFACGSAVGDGDAAVNV